MVGITCKHIPKYVLCNNKQYVETNKKFKKTVGTRFVWNNSGDQKSISDEDGLTELHCRLIMDKHTLLKKMLKTTELHDL